MGRSRGVNAPVSSPSFDRRRFLVGAGALVVSAPALAATAAHAAEPLSPGAAPPSAKPPLRPDELDSWVAVARDGQVTAFFGKPDVGQGVDVAIAQIVAEELDVGVDRVTVIGGDTTLTCNQGGVSGSTGVQLGGRQLRLAAAEARRVLVELAASKLGVTADKLQVEGGVVSLAGDPAKHVSYAQLIGDGYFHAKLDWNGQLGNGLVASGKAKPKTPDQYKLVGVAVPRRDIAGKVFGTHEYIADMKVPGMVYGRVLRPPVAGAVPVSVDEASIAHIPGAKVVRKADFIGVVANTEWDIVQASRALKVTWSDATPAFFDEADLYDHIRKTPAAKTQVEKTIGDVDAAFAAKGARIIEHEYEWPFQSHSSLAPACAIADVRPDGVTLWHASQKPHASSEGIAKLLGRPVATVRSVSVSGPGSYGRNDAGDAAADAAILSAAVGKPVRLQGQRSDGHAWDPKGAASVHKVRAAIDADGRITAYEYMSKGFSRAEVATAETGANDLLAGQLTGFDNPPVHGFGTPEEAYDFPNRRMGWATIPTLLAKASPLRTSHLRDPLGPQLHFASEQFMDECATALGADPIDFRLRHLKDPRHIEVVQKLADAASWAPGPPGTRQGDFLDGMTGRGFAYCNRGDTVVAVVSDVVVNLETGRVWPIGFYVAHDCGLIINPSGLKQCIEGNVVHGASRALFEETKFDARNVTSVDWATYPILDIMDAPERIEVILINRPDRAPSGAGEPSTRPIAAAIANAIFEATGARVRRAPFTPERVKAAIAAIDRKAPGPLTKPATKTGPRRG